MVFKELANKMICAISKYKYAVVVLLIGIALLLIPQKTQSAPTVENTQEQCTQIIETTELEEILQSVQGAGKVKVLLSVATGEKTIYQTDSEANTSSDSNSTKQETVIVTDGQRAEAGLINQVNPPTYLGAIVVCEGADSPSVRLSVTQAVARITGLGSDSICVLKMES